MVTIQDCGNAALVVNGSKVEATNLNTHGNAWGAVNVDIGAALSEATASFELKSGTLEETAKIWTEKDVSNDSETNTSPVTITVPNDWKAKEMKSYDGKTYYADKALL